MKECCENCKYCAEVVDDFMFDAEAFEEAVFCHRYPPMPCTIPKVKKVKADLQFAWGWPFVAKTQWCGEYEPKEEQTE